MFLAFDIIITNTFCWARLTLKDERDIHISRHQAIAMGVFNENLYLRESLYLQYYCHFICNLL